MNYTVKSYLRGGIFAVPNDVVDKHIKMCSAIHLKVLLMGLRNPEACFDSDEASALLGISAADVCDAANYWVAAGLFECESEPSAEPAAVAAFAFKSQPETVAESHEAPTGQKVTMVHGRTKLTTGDINKLAKSDSNVSMLLQECQTRLGKELAPAESESLVWLYSYLRLSADYILMVIEFCKSEGKGNMRSIERTAVSWFDSGIDTHAKAEAHIMRLSQQSGYEKQIKLTFGIHDRELSSKEKEFARVWCEDFGFGVDMIRLAYEKTVDQTGKLSFPYCGKILSSWHAAGITSPKQASEERKPQSSIQKNSPKGGYSSFDLDEVENLLRNKK